MRDKIKRRSLSSFHVKIEGKMGDSVVQSWFYRCCGKKNFQKLAKERHLSEREIQKFRVDYHDLKDVYEKLNKKKLESTVLGLVVLPNFQK